MELFLKLIVHEQCQWRPFGNCGRTFAGLRVGKKSRIGFERRLPPLRFRLGSLTLPPLVLTRWKQARPITLSLVAFLARRVGVHHLGIYCVGEDG